jgi:hypothetical protein
MSVDQTKSLAGRIGAATKWASCPDRSAATEAARKAAFDRFSRQVDPEGKLPPAERATRAEHARRAHFLKMAAASAKARRERAARTAAEHEQLLATNAADREERIAEAERLAGGAA